MIDFAPDCHLPQNATYSPSNRSIFFAEIGETDDRQSKKTSQLTDLHDDWQDGQVITPRLRLSTKLSQLEAIQKWSAICPVWPWTLTYQNSFCAFLARVKAYTYANN